MERKLRVGVLGATGMVGQRFISLLENHPWYEVVTVAASPRSAGKTYEEAVAGRWKMTTPMPEAVKKLTVMDVNQVEQVAATVDFVFSAVDMTKDEIRAIEEAYAKTETPVVSNNSAHRWTPDVPMVIPEVNPEHFAVRQYKKYKLAAGKTAKSILISCGARLAPFDIQELRDLMAYDELELDMLGERRTAMFVIISDTDDTFNFVVAIMYTQLFNLLCDKADDEHGGRLPYHVRLLLDEFANIGSIPKFDKLIATIRSREISASIILQSQSQLKTIYKDAAETITGNCDTMLFLGGKESSTLKEISETLGKAGYQSSCLHGDIKQETRTKVMNQFRSGAFPILIATDVAARGIDVDDVDLVINYDLPQDDEYYIHRVGRTGRAGKSGEAVTLIYPAQRRDLSRVISYTKADIRRKQFPDSEQLKAFSRRRFIDEISEACRKGSDDDTIALTYELMAQGIAPFNLISTLIAMNYRPKDLDTSSLIKAQRRQKERMRTLSLSLGKQDGIRTGHVVAAIIEASGIDADAIGAVHIHNRSTSVDIAAEQIDLVVKKMKKAKIRGKNVRVSREEKAEKEPAQKKRAENGKKKNRSSESLKKKKFRKTKKEKQ